MAAHPLPYVRPEQTGYTLVLNDGRALPDSGSLKASTRSIRTGMYKIGPRWYMSSVVPL